MELFEMLTIEEAIARVPFLANTKELNVNKLDGGITNQNFRVDYGKQSCVIRITGADTEILGIRRDIEYAANLDAGRLGIAPEVLFFIKPEGYLVTRFVDGNKIPQVNMTETKNIRRVVKKVSNYHNNAQKLNGEFNVFRRIEWFRSVSKRYNSKLPNDFDWFLQKINKAEKSFLKEPYIPTPCHNDLLNLNFLDEFGDLKILDWEYAGMGDLFFDLANFSQHHMFTDEQDKIELHEYFGHVSPKQFARLKLMKPMSEIHEAMWGTTQEEISKLDEDFQGYADCWFNRARSDLQDSRFDQWLIDMDGL